MDHVGRESDERPLMMSEWTASKIELFMVGSGTKRMSKPVRWISFVMFRSNTNNICSLVVKLKCVILLVYNSWIQTQTDNRYRLHLNMNSNTTQNYSIPFFLCSKTRFPTMSFRNAHFFVLFSFEIIFWIV